MSSERLHPNAFLWSPRYGIPFPELEDSYKDDRANLELKKKVEDIKRSYPEIISDSEPTSSN